MNNLMHSGKLEVLQLWEQNRGLFHQSVLLLLLLLLNAGTYVRELVHREHSIPGRVVLPQHLCQGGNVFAFKLKAKREILENEVIQEKEKLVNAVIILSWKIAPIEIILLDVNKMLDSFGLIYVELLVVIRNVTYDW